MQIARKRARTELTINSPPKSVCRACDRPQRRRSRRQRRARARTDGGRSPHVPYRRACWYVEALVRERARSAASRWRRSPPPGA